MPQYEQNRRRWAGQRGDWDTDRGREQWPGPRGGSFWHDSGVEYSSAGAGDEDWHYGNRGYPGGDDDWEGGGERPSGPGYEGDFGRGRKDDYGRTWGRGRSGGYYGTDALRDGFGRFSYGGPGARYGSQGGYYDRGFGTEPYADQFGRDLGGRYGADEWGRSWSGEGPFAGRGPRGYQRSDDRIKEDVCETLTAHGNVDASDIDVRVENGEVTLTGHVTDRGQKRMAEDAVDGVSGVRDVHNKLHITHGQHGMPGDQTEAGQRREAVGAGASANSKSR